MTVTNKLTDRLLVFIFFSVVFHAVATAGECLVRYVPVMATLGPRPIANPLGEASKPVPTRVTVGRVVHQRVPPAVNALIDLRSHPESDAYRQRYSGPQGLRYAIADAGNLNDLPAFRAAVAQAIPDPSKRRRETFRELKMNPVMNAASGGAVAIVEQIIQWDPSALTEPYPGYLDEALARTIAHWRSVARQDINAHEDDAVAYEPDKKIARDHQRLLNIFLKAGAKPRQIGPGLGNFELDDVASITPSKEVLEVAEQFMGAGLSINPEQENHPSPFASASAQMNFELVQLMMKIQRPSQSSLDQAIAVTPKVQANPLIQFLLENGANINAPNSVNATFDPLREAATRFQVFHEDRLIRLLMQYKANPNRTPPGLNNSALTLILSDPTLAIDLLEQGADPNWRDGQGNTVLHRVTNTISNSYTPVVVLEATARAQLISMLLAHGADPNAKNKAGVTPLMLLSADEGPSIDVLIAAGANLNLSEKDTHYRVVDVPTQKLLPFQIGPIVWAILKHNDYLAAALLIRAKLLDLDDCGAVYYAAETGAAKTLGALLDIGAESQLVSVEGARTRTPLQIAAERGHAATVKVLLDRKVAEVNEATLRKALSLEDVAAAARYGVFVLATGGETPLMLAAQGGRADVVSELLRHGADLDRRDYMGYSALKYARMASKQGNVSAAEVERILVAHGARE